MASARPPIVDFLEKEFVKDPEAITACFDESKEAFSNRYKTLRIFDNFPCMLNARDLKKLVTRLVNQIVRVSPALADNPENFTRLPVPVKAEIENLIAQVATHGFNDLLDDTGHIHQELASLIGWPEEISQQTVFDMMCAYVGAMNACVMLEMQTKIHPDDFKRANLLISYLNKNYSRCTMDALKKSNKFFDADALARIDTTRDSTLLKELVLFTVQNPGTAAVIATVAFGALGAFSVFAITALSAINNANGSSVEPRGPGAGPQPRR